MAWTHKQRTLFLMAAKAAGWNDDQRYIAMRHCGCPLKAGTPSVTHPRNDNAAYERCMALAESCAGQRGEHVPPPRGKRSWREAETNQSSRLKRFAGAICGEAERVLPAHFDRGLLGATMQHVCGSDTWSRSVHWATSLGRELSLDDLDAGQLYRVVESLKAHVGRVFLEHGLTPQSFAVPRSARQRVATRAALEGAAG